ncbi:MAG: LysR family transcriptional regulator [Rhizobiaceae bacterium]|nr:LysR family transcriptional regulator [Rhizobiaceae bacterium]
MSYVNNLKTFVRVYELGSMSAAGRDLRISPAVSSSRISELEKHLGARLFNRTTRNLTPTQQGELFYKGAVKILDTINEVEGSVSEITSKPKGTIFVSAPLGIGKKVIAPIVPAFQEIYPDINVRLRLSDRKVDITNEGLDAAFVLGRLIDSELRVLPIYDFDRVLCASPEYIKNHGMPERAGDLFIYNHRCLLLRYPGLTEFFWSLKTGDQIERYEFVSPLESDDGDVLTDWALSGCGIINKPVFEVKQYLQSGELVEVVKETPPISLPFSCVYPHKRLQDPKIRLFIDFMSKELKKQLVDGSA